MTKSEYNTRTKRNKERIGYVVYRLWNTPENAPFKMKRLEELEDKCCDVYLDRYRYLSVGYIPPEITLEDKLVFIDQAMSAKRAEERFPYLIVGDVVKFYNVETGFANYYYINPPASGWIEYDVTAQAIELVQGTDARPRFWRKRAN